MSSLPPEATGVITIDLGVLADNWRALSKHVAPAECGAVVKADAYGLGAGRVIPALAEAGCRTFFVATAREALAARMLAPAATLYVLDGLLPGSADAVRRADATPVLASLPEVEAWAAAADHAGRPLPAALQIDTGLNRLGLAESEIEALAARPGLLARLDLTLVMSHLASADDPKDPKNEAQRSAFERRRAKLPAATASLAASDGLMLGKAYHFDLVRPGYALYGGQAFRGGPTPVRSVVTVAARILQVRDVAAGETVGYSGTWTATRTSRIAIIAAGYADGIARTLGATGGEKRGVVEIAGTLAPIAGRVSMDLITVDVTDVDRPIVPGDLATLIGPRIPLEGMGHAAGTIGYEILTRLGRRFHRHYVIEAANG